jgi:tetratricopeptide (TPR) repeat protein
LRAIRSKAAWLLALVLLVVVTFRTPRGELQGQSRTRQPYSPLPTAVLYGTRGVAVADESAAAAAFRAQVDAVRAADAGTRLDAAYTGLALFRREGDPRVLGEIEALLLEQPNERSAEALVVLATVRQSLHDFDGALELLGKALFVAPELDQAWLLKASIHTVQGRFPQALEACSHLRDEVAALYRAVCTSSVQSMHGEARSAYGNLRQMVERTRSLSVADQGYFQGLLAEFAFRANLPSEGEAHLNRSLLLEPSDSYTLALWADRKLATGSTRDADDVLRKLAGTNHDGLLLRVAVAEKIRRSPETAAPKLRQLFAAARQRKERVHLREEARFQLDVEGAPVEALALAEANWQVQREVADALVFLRAAAAANTHERARPVLAWLDETQCEDPSLRAVRGSYP